MYKKFLEIELTGRCDSKCRHCYGDFPQNEELPKQKIMEIIDQIPSDYAIIFSGGDPFFHKNLAELVHYSKNGVWITTTGHLLTKEALESLGEHANLVFSLDGIDVTHDWYRRNPGSYKKVIQALELTKDRPKEIITTLWKGMLHQIDDIIETGRKYNALVHFNALIPVGKARVNREILLTKKEKETVYEKLNSLKGSGIFTDLYKVTEKDRRNGIDLFCKGRFSVGVNGDVRPCEFYHRMFGNIFEHGFAEIMEEARKSTFYQARERGFKDHIPLDLDDPFDYHTGMCHRISI